jgi:hypothetical protein
MTPNSTYLKLESAVLVLSFFFCSESRRLRVALVIQENEQEVFRKMVFMFV